MTARTDSARLQFLERGTRWGFGAALVLVGVSLGVVPDLIGGGLGAEDFARRLAALGLMGVLTLVALGTAWFFARRSKTLRRSRGTLYVVDSPLETWTREGKDAYLSAAGPEFAGFVTVPGPTDLSSWRWPLQDMRATLWSRAVDDLVVSFRSLWLTDDRETPDSVVCWMAFPVAIAWAARVCSADRTLSLGIRQRPSLGRAGPVGLAPWTQESLTFPARATSASRENPPVRHAELQIASDSAEGGPVTWPSEVRVLLVRATAEQWGPLKADDETGPVSVVVTNRSGQPWRAGGPAELHEWRCLPPQGKLHAWDTYSDMAAEIVEWIARTATDDGLTLIGMVVPQEVGVGIGIHIARRDQGTWPESLWPIVKSSAEGALFVPGLDLGWTSLRTPHLRANP